MFAEIAREFGLRFFATSKHRAESLKVIYNERFSELFTEQDDSLGVLDGLFGTGRANYFANAYAAFQKVIVVFATGWEKQFRVVEAGRLVTIRAPYSEHCSYSELVDFCTSIQFDECESIISKADTKTLQALMQKGG